MGGGRKQGVLLIGLSLMLATTGLGRAHPLTGEESPLRAADDSARPAARDAPLSFVSRPPVDGLPSGEEALSHEWPDLWGSPFDDGQSLGSLDGADPLASALRPQSRGRARRTQVPVGGGKSGIAQNPPPPAEEDLTLAIRQLQDTLASEIADALDVRKGDDGRIRFSVAGVDGFHASTGGRVSMGYGDVSLDFGERSDRAATGLPGEGPSPALAAAPLPAQGAATREVFQFIGEVIQYPLFWVVVVVLLAGKIGWLVFSYRERRRGRRGRSMKRPLHQTKRPRVRVRVRKRIRYRLGQPPHSGGIPDVRSS